LFVVLDPFIAGRAAGPGVAQALASSASGQTQGTTDAAVIGSELVAEMPLAGHPPALRRLGVEVDLRNLGQAPLEWRARVLE
jgi:hypothetical protein